MIGCDLAEMQSPPILSAEAQGSRREKLEESHLNPCSSKPVIICLSKRDKQYRGMGSVG